LIPERRLGSEGAARAGSSPGTQKTGAADAPWPAPLASQRDGPEAVAAVTLAIRRHGKKKVTIGMQVAPVNRPPIVGGVILEKAHAHGALEG
jgi:hypothetical protein